MDPTTIRPRTPDDVAACVALLEVTHVRDGYPRYAKENGAAFLAPPQELSAWVAERAGAVVGHVALHAAEHDPTLAVATAATGRTADRLAVVARLLVAPDARRVGLGRRLLDTAVEAAAAQDRRSVLDVVDDGAPAIALYEGAGWSYQGRTVLRLDADRSLDLLVYLSPDPAA